MRKQGLSKKNAEEQSKKDLTRFVMKFKSKKKKLTESFFVRYRHWNENGKAAWLKRIKTKSKLPVNIEYDTRVIKDSIGRFYVIMLKPLEKVKTRSFTDFEKVISLDPGVRTFLTGYATDGFSYEFGKDGMNRIFRHLYRADRIQSEMNRVTSCQTLKYNHKKRQNMRRAMFVC